MSVDPQKVLDLTKRVWKYVKGTLSYKLHYKLHATLHDKLLSYGDASWATGASKSQTGLSVCWGEHPLAWKSSRQTVTAWSALEAEVDAAAGTTQAGVTIKRMLSQLLQREVDANLISDNAACAVHVFVMTAHFSQCGRGLLASAAPSSGIKQSAKDWISIICPETISQLMLSVRFSVEGRLKQQGTS